MYHLTTLGHNHYLETSVLRYTAIRSFQFSDLSHIHFQPTDFGLAFRKCVRDTHRQQITILGHTPHHLVPIRTRKILVNKKEAGTDPKKNEGRTHYALGTSEQGPRFRKNGY